MEHQHSDEDGEGSIPLGQSRRLTLHVYNGSDDMSVSVAYGRYLAAAVAPETGEHGEAEAHAVTPASLGQDFLPSHERAGDEAPRRHPPAGDVNAGIFRVFDHDPMVRVEAEGGRVHGRGEEVPRRSAASSSSFTEQLVGNGGESPHGDENGEGALRRRAASLSDGIFISSFYGRYLAARDHGKAKVEVVTTACSRRGDRTAEVFLLHHEGGAGGNHECVAAPASSESHRDGCNMRAPLVVDVCIARERIGGVAPSWLDTARRLGISYWVHALKNWVASRLLGFGSRIPTIPMAWSWLSVMSPPVFQTGGHDGRGDGSCVICSSAMCIHAQHRLAFERLNGAGLFPYELVDMDYLKSASEAAGVWSPATGSYPADMLDFIKLEFPGGLRCRAAVAGGWRACSLPFKAHATFLRKELAPIAAMFMLRYWGPMIGTLYAGRRYSLGNWNPDYIYRGDPASSSSSSSNTADHAALCVAYRVTRKSELLIRVLDNQRPHGPLRWISYTAFMEFTCVQVDALSIHDLPVEPRSVLQRMLSWLIRPRT